MAAQSANRERYREYTNYLRVSAVGLNMQIAPARLDRLRSQVNLERKKFLLWVVVWLLIAMVSLVPIILLAAVEFNLTLPTSIADRAGAFHHQVSTLENVGAVAIAIASSLMFVFAVVIAYAPLLANSESLNDLEAAHRALKSIRK